MGERLEKGDTPCLYLVVLVMEAGTRKHGSGLQKGLPAAPGRLCSSATLSCLQTTENLMEHFILRLVVEEKEVLKVRKGAKLYYFR